MSEQLDLIEFICPDCDTFINRSFPWFRQCSTCGGAGKVLVRREDLIKLSSVKR